MAKIENTTVYPTVLPASNDLLIATDVSNDNATVTFLVSSLTGAGGVAQDLQSVLTTGNTAVEDINLTGNIIVTGMVQPTTIGASNGIGTAGQVLSSTGAGLQWIAAAGATNQNLDQTLTVGNASSQNIVLSNALYMSNGVGGGVAISNSGTLTNTGISTFTGNVNINSTDLIFNTTGQISAGGSTGTVGQWLVSTGTGLAWSSTIPPSNCCPLQSTLLGGNTANNIGIIFTGTSTTSFSAGNSITSLGNNTWGGTNVFSGAVTLSSTLSDGSTVGTAGQILSSTGTGLQWINSVSSTNTLQQVLDVGNSATGVNANITISGSFSSGSIIDFSGSNGVAGQVLQSNGGNYSWVSQSCCDLDQTLAVGNSSNNSIILGGTSTITVPTIIPTNIQVPSGSTGSNGQYLGITGGALSWINSTSTDTTYSLLVPTATTNLQLFDNNGFAQNVSLTGGSGITITRNSASQLTWSNDGIISFTLGTPLISVGTPLTTITTNGAVTLSPRIYNGGSNIGVVPAGGTNTSFLRGDGTWQPAGGLAGFSLQTAGTSIGFPLTGIVNAGNVFLLTPNAYAGTTNVGFVPSGATGATEYLDGSGNWSIPSGGAGGVTTLSLGITTGQTVPLIGSIVGATLTLDANTFGGSNLLGFVPSSILASQTTTFLRADGTWVAPTGTAGVQTVSSVANAGLSSPLVATIVGNNLSLQPNRFSGGANEGFVPSSFGQGQTTDFLRADGTWVAPLGAAGVTAVSFSNQVGGTQLLTGTIGGSTLNLVSNSYSGGNNVGYVPPAGTNTTFLRGDGTWQVPPGSGAIVTSVSSNDGVSSVGQAITVNNTAVGAITLDAFEYNGDTNVGYVPTGSGNNDKLFLNGQGNWTDPSVGSGKAGSFATDFKFGVKNQNLTSGRWSYPDIYASQWNPESGTKLVQVSIFAVTSWTQSQRNAAMVYSNAMYDGNVSCDSTSIKSVLCKAQLTVVGSAELSYSMELYKWSPCDASETVTTIGQASFDTVSGEAVCVDFTLNAGTTFSGSEALLFTIVGTSVGTASLQGRVDLRWTYTA